MAQALWRSFTDTDTSLQTYTIQQLFSVLHQRGCHDYCPDSRMCTGGNDGAADMEDTGTVPINVPPFDIYICHQMIVDYYKYTAHE